MSSSIRTTLIAVDVGNARMKLGLFRACAGEGLPEPEETLGLSPGSPHPGPLPEGEGDSFSPLPKAEGDLGQLAAWLDRLKLQRAAWWIGSVNRPAATRLVDWLRTNRPHDEVRLLAAGDLPLAVSLERPDMVGIDRLLDAVAANRLRDPRRPAVIVDVGSAITVDLVSADGAFQGGAILPGIAMAARAMHEFTDLLPLVETGDLANPPAALGTATVPAMQSGLFWGAVGAIERLIRELAGTQPADVFLTGGAGVAVAALLGPETQHVPHLTLAGIALAHKAATGGRAP